MGHRKSVIAIVLAIIIGMAFTDGYADPVAAASTPDKVRNVKVQRISGNTLKVTWSKVKGAYGYQVKRGSKVIKKTTSCSYTDKKLKHATAYTYKVRAYKIEKKTKWYNKKTKEWQSKKPKAKYCGKKKIVKKYIYGKYGKGRGTTAFRYKYDVKFFRQPYSELPVGYFVKTNNPDIYNFEVIIYKNEKNQNKYNYNVSHYRNPSGEEAPTIVASADFADLQKEEPDVIPETWKVSGGVVSNVGVEKPGKYIVKVREYPKGKTFVDYYTDRCSCAEVRIGKITVRDLIKAEDNWMNAIIKKVTTNSMSKKEKMQAIADYLYDTTKYWKNYIDSNGEMQYLSLIVDEGIPSIISGEWNSADSPAVLCKFGDKIGYPLHNMFGDYPRGSAAWEEYHFCAKSKQDGTIYSFCKPSYSNVYANIHSPDDVPKVNCLTYNKYYLCY